MVAQAKKVPNTIDTKTQENVVHSVSLTWKWSSPLEDSHRS